MTREEIEQWREAQLQRSQFAVSEIRQAAMQEWSIQDGRLVHSTGGFFSVAGLRFNDRQQPGAKRWQPFIVQPEIGILGFIVARRAGETCLLVQAKTEPGNPGGAQLAPTFQATESNYRRRHGGPSAPFSEHFHERGSGAVLTDSLQSEQGTRFLNKYNRNMLVEAEPGRIEGTLRDDTAWRWMTLEDVRRHIVSDLLFNTDARSVIAVSDWGLFCDGGRPFERHEKAGRIGHDLWRSYQATPSPAAVEEILSWLRSRQGTFTPGAEIVPLEALQGWGIGDHGIVSTDSEAVSVRYYSVQALDREVPRWSQPLLSSGTQGTILFVMQVRDGVLKILVGVSHEPGFANAAQLSAPFQAIPGEATADGRDPVAMLRQWGAPEDVVLVDCLMSDEGGRFFQDLNRYVLAVAPPEVHFPPDADQRWLTLGETTALKHIPGVFTNEFRSALSLLVHYL